MLATVTAVAAIVAAIVAPLATSGPSTVAGSPIAAGNGQAAPSSSQPSSTPPTSSTTTTSKRSVLDPEPDANPAACKIVSWADLPPDVRPKKPKEPQPRSTEVPTVFRCWMDNSEVGVVVNDPSAGPGAHATGTLYFKADLYLGPEINADVNDHKDNPKLDEVREVTVADQYPGVLVRDRASDGTKKIPRCFVAFRAHGNKALAEIMNDLFPQYNACDLAMQLAEKVAPRVR